MLLPFRVEAQVGRPTEYQVKAAYLFNFGRFVKWPETSGSVRGTFAICVIGSDPFGSVLDSTVSGEHLDGKKVVVKRIASPSDALSCQILYISNSEEAKWSSIASTLGRAPVLTVSDISGFTEHQGMVQFIVSNDRVRFQVNLSAAQKAGLSMSSELLKVATSVKGQPGE